MRARLLLLITLLFGAPSCDQVCPDEKAASSTGEPDPPGVDPTEGPPMRVCGQIQTDPEVACGLVCVDEEGVELVVLCDYLGAYMWHCGVYPRSGPAVGELYQGRPVWCGGDGELL